MYYSLVFFVLCILIDFTEILEYLKPYYSSKFFWNKFCENKYIDMYVYNLKNAIHILRNLIL